MQVDSASMKNLCELFGSPYISRLVYRKSTKDSSNHGKIQKKIFKDKNTQKSKFLKGKHSETNCNFGKIKWTNFIDW